MSAAGHRCPGRHFAEAEIALAVALLLGRFRLTLQGAINSGEAGAAGGRQGLKCTPGRASNVRTGSNCWVPGDAEGMLPMPEMRRQVGVRWPRLPCWVQVERRSGEEAW